MAKSNKKKEVRDGFLGDLPENLRSRIMNIHKLVIETLNATMKDKHYKDIIQTQWAKSMIDEFLTVPTDKKQTGSVRVYKQGKRYSCMIQLTGHVTNDRNDIDHELFHDMIRNTHISMRPKVRRKYDLTLTCESEHGEHFEGFDVWTKQKEAKEIWELFEDKKTKQIKEYEEGTNPFGPRIPKDTSSEDEKNKLINELKNLKKEVNKVNSDIDDLDKREHEFHNNEMDAIRRVHKDQVLLPSVNPQQDNAFKLEKQGLLNKRSNLVAKMNKVGYTLQAKYNVDLRSVNLNEFANVIFAEMCDLPLGLQYDITSARKIIVESIDKISKEETYESFLKETVSYTNFYENIIGKLPSSISIGDTVLRENGNGSYEGYIVITPEPITEVTSENYEETNSLADELLESVMESIGDTFYQENPCKELILSGNNGNKFFEFKLSPEYAEMLYERMEYNEGIAVTEATNNTPEYNTDMSEAEARRTLRTLSQNIINDIKNKKDYKVTQYTANIYANIISKNLLPLWSKGFRKLTISLDSYQSFFTFEFKVPNMTQDFVSRFIEGRESINGFIHRTPEIRIKMSPRIFHTMENPDDAYNFFRAAVKYYNEGLTKASEKLMASTMKLNREMKHLISTTKLSGIVTLPMQLLFVFDDVHMSNKETFKISSDDIKTVNQFVKNIYTRYASPEKEKKQIVDDVREMVKSLQESCEADYNINQLKEFPEAVESYLNGGMDSIMESYKNDCITEQLDVDWIRNQKNSQTKYLQEKFGVKKLKKIPTDLVAYITIEAECIKDANDKMMIASYCLSKIEIVEWYIELLEVGSKKYIVPHTKPYLQSVRTQLLACYKKIMDTPIPKSTERPLIDIKYPKGYEG